MNEPSARAHPDVILGLVAAALVVLPLPALAAVGAQDLFRLLLFAAGATPIAVYAGIACRGCRHGEMRAERVRIRR